MCGICGVRTFDNSVPSTTVLDSMNAAIAHRGPDGEGRHVSEGIGLAMRRLSIVDLVTGDQPIYNEDQSAVVVYNGEIYNHRHVRTTLQQAGHVYRTQSDTETIVHGYEQYGVNVLDHLRGMFAFAIWDARRETLLLARDRLGEKPLYYAELPNQLIFASEIKALLRHPLLAAEVDERALDLYLTLGYVPAPYTMFKGVLKLPPAHRLVANGREIRVERYWDTDCEPRPAMGDRRQATEELRQLVTESVVERLMSDVPLGAYLSGGVDSTLVVGLMSRAMDRPVDTYSVGFDESFGVAAKFNTDSHFAELASKQFGTNHHPVMLSKSDRVDELIPQLVAQMDEPLANPNAVATYLVSRQARADGLKVLLTGDGSDELFAGYDRYRYDERLDQYQLLPQWLRRNLTSPLLATVGGAAGRFVAKADGESMTERYLIWHAIFSAGDKHALLARPLSVDSSAVQEQVIGAVMRQGGFRRTQERMAMTDLKLWVAEESNMRVDKCAMYGSIETRAPFLNHPLVEFAAGMPFDWKLRRGTSKYILKQAFADLIPPEIANRPKVGFTSPASKWLRRDLRPLAEKMLSPKMLKASGYFSIPAVTEKLEAHVNNREYHATALWVLMTFQIWFDRYILRGNHD